MGARNGHGGTRPGAGRKPKALLHQATAAAVESRIAEALPEIIDRLIASAKGGDVAAARYLVDRLLGRVATVPAAPAEDTRQPFSEEDAQIAAADAESSREMGRLLSGLGRRQISDPREGPM